MAETARTKGRNGKIWREYCRGETIEELAERYSLSPQRISQILADVRNSIPDLERAELIKEEVDFFRQSRVEVLRLWDMDASPVTAGKDGDIVRDPETGEVVRDHSGRLAAMSMAEKLSARMHKLLGLEATQKVDVSFSEEEAARRAAGEAVSYVHGQITGEANG